MKYTEHIVYWKSNRYRLILEIYGKKLEYKTGRDIFGGGGGGGGDGEGMDLVP